MTNALGAMMTGSTQRERGASVDMRWQLDQRELMRHRVLIDGVFPRHLFVRFTIGRLPHAISRPTVRVARAGSDRSSSAIRLKAARLNPCASRAMSCSP